MSSLLEMLAEKIGGENLSMISKEVGADEETTRSAMGAALPMLIGALSKNAATEDGAAGIQGAIEKDHDGSILENLSGFLGNKQYDEPRSGAGILGHLLGGKQESVSQGISKASGMSSAGAGTLMKMLAPMVMGALSKQKQSQGLDVGGIMGFLGKEKESVEKQGGGLVGRMLDQDGDGDFDMSDMAKMAMGKLFGK